MIHKNTHIIYITHVLTHTNYITCITYITHTSYITDTIYITDIIYLTHISYITHIVYTTHMIELIFKAYEKSCENIFLQFFFYIYVNRILSKKKKKKKKKARERYQNLPQKAKCANIFVSDIEIFLKKKNKRGINMVVNNLKNFLKMKRKGFNFYFLPQVTPKKNFFLNLNFYRLVLEI